MSPDEAITLALTVDQWRALDEAVETIIDDLESSGRAVPNDLREAHAHVLYGPLGEAVP
jgi:hypothetical protein